MNEFYQMNPKLLMRYQPFLGKRLEQMAENSHYNGWVYGQYMAASIAANFSKRKYPKQPYYMMDLGVGNDEEEARPLTDAERFQMFALQFNADHKSLPTIEAKESEVKVIEESNVPSGD